MNLLPFLFAPQQPSVGAARLGLGYPGMGNASVAIYALHPLELELGVEGSLGHKGLTARGGPALAVLERRSESGRGVTAHAPMLVGYRHLDFGREAAGHQLTLNPTFTIDLWLLEHLALELSVSAGVAFAVWDPSSGIGPVGPDLALRGGLAF